MFAGIALGFSFLSGGSFSFYSHGPYDAAVPKPESILGYEVGTHHTVYADQDRVTAAIAKAAPDRVKLIEYGKSTEGRTLRVFAISSPKNIASLAKIQKGMSQIANPQPGSNPKEVAKDLPTVLWVNQCIHGDETASFESGMQLIYNLAASQAPEITKLLDNAVVIVNPVYNPDGHERYVVGYNSIPQGNPEQGSYDRAMPSAFMGRYNHYRFDMNRDRISMSQAETRQEVALFLQWNPQVYVDQHGQVETYFFPPVQQAINVNVGRDRYNHWTNIFGRATAADFDKNGWQYYIRDQFDLYNACYLDSQTTLMGAIGMTHETDGGRVMSSRREDGTLLTLLAGVKKHFTSALAVLQSAASHRAELLNSYIKYKEDAVSGAHAGKMKRVVLASADSRELQRLADHLARTGIVSYFSKEKWTQKTAHDYWSGGISKQEFPANSLLVDMAQPQGPLAKALLEPGSDFEPDFIKRQKDKVKTDREKRRNPELDSFEFYDGTAWALPYAYNLKAWWCEDAPRLEGAVDSQTEQPRPLEYHGILPQPNPTPPVKVNAGLNLGVPSPVGYYLTYTDQEDILFAAAALQAGYKVSMSTKVIKVGGLTLPEGTFMFLAARNEDSFDEGLMRLASSKQIELKGLTTSFPDEGRHGPGSGNMVQLKKPNIGVVFGSAGTLSGGALWYLLEKEFGLKFSSLTTGALNQNLDKFTSIVLPGGVQGSTSGALADWVRGGGTVVALENATWAIGEKGYVKLESVKADTALPGSLFRADLDPLSGLSFGYPHNGNNPIPIAVPIEGDEFFKAPKEGSDVSLSADKAIKKLLSGWAWDETDKDLMGISWLHHAQVGRGHAILFSNDPTSRAQWPGLHKLLLNAMIVYPSL
ncbi:MAG: hypothetical protein K8R88_08900 [Armatimonadetes bacterium]|nr:hypothetical protein [Armatimonadota bacterium]